MQHRGRDVLGKKSQGSIPTWLPWLKWGFAMAL